MARSFRPVYGGEGLNNPRGNTTSQPNDENLAMVPSPSSNALPQSDDGENDHVVPSTSFAVIANINTVPKQPVNSNEINDCCYCMQCHYVNQTVNCCVSKKTFHQSISIPFNIDGIVCSFKCARSQNN